MAKSQYSETVIKQYMLMCGKKQINKEVLFHDIQVLKNDSNSFKDFEKKYPEFFNGNIASYGLTPRTPYKNKSERDSKLRQSFLGSYRRASNSKNYNKLKDAQYKSYAVNLDKQTVIKPKKKRLSSKAGVDYKEVKKEQKVVKKFRDVKNYPTIDSNHLKNLDDIYNLKIVKQHNLYHTQEVQVLVNFLAYDVISTGYGDIDVQIENPDTHDGSWWITIESGISIDKKVSLYKLREIALERYKEWIEQYVKKYKKKVIVIQEVLRVIRTASEKIVGVKP